MPTSEELTVDRLSPNDVQPMKALLSVFSEAFDDPESYRHAPPSESYLKERLGSDEFIALVARADNQIVGGLAAYELKKFEQERSEIYIYDLAVAAPYRRRGIGTALIDRLRHIASARGAYVLFVQADLGDKPAIALYTKLGLREDVLHFDIQVG